MNISEKRPQSSTIAWLKTNFKWHSVCVVRHCNMSTSWFGHGRQWHEIHSHRKYSKKSSINFGFIIKYKKRIHFRVLFLNSIMLESKSGEEEKWGINWELGNFWIIFFKLHTRGQVSTYLIYSCPQNLLTIHHTNFHIIHN